MTNPISVPRRGFLRLAAALFALACGASSVAAADAEALAGRALLAALRTGGLVLYFRHASTDFGQNDEQMTGYEDCARQRNLTDEGRDEARAIGAAGFRVVARIPKDGWDSLATP